MPLLDGIRGLMKNMIKNLYDKYNIYELAPVEQVRDSLGMKNKVFYRS